MKHPADLMAPIMIAINALYDITNKTLIKLYDSERKIGEPVKLNWNSIDDACDKLDESLIKLDQKWIEVSQKETAEPKEDIEGDLETVNQSIEELQKLIVG